MHRRSGDHTGIAPTRQRLERGAGTVCDCRIPRRPCTADLATTRDRPYKTPAERGDGNQYRRHYFRAWLAVSHFRSDRATWWLIAPTRRPQETGAAIMYDCVSAVPKHHRSGDHKGSPLQETRRKEAREPSATLVSLPPMHRRSGDHILGFIAPNKYSPVGITGTRIPCLRTTYPATLRRSQPIRATT